MTSGKRADPELPPGAARDLVDLFRRLRGTSQLRVGQIANRTGYAPSHISEVLRGWKTPSPAAAVKIAQVLGGDKGTVERARRRAEDAREWKRDNAKTRSGGQGGAPGSGGRDGPGLPRFPLWQRLSSPDVEVHIIAGDLFEQDTHLAVAFSDTFDTSIADDRIIHSSSVQGQLLRVLFGGDLRRLDEELVAALADVAPARVELRQDKPGGKLVRYPLGTVAVLGEPRQLIFAIALGHMSNDLITRAPVSELWHCYTNLWEAVYRRGQRTPLSVPLLGSGLARVDTLDRENLLQLILLSFVAYSRLRVVCHQLRVVIPPSDIDRLSPARLQAFLQGL
jgi:transcriptional regulator with XRE-family HTH domain